jgi:molybdopterin synthase catalytic subunit
LTQSPDYEKVGAIGTFIGIVRGETADGDKVSELELEAYEEKADEVLEGICRDLEKRDGIIDVQIYHFLGNFSVGEELVHVIVAGSHRGEVFETLELAVEGYKKKAPIFKKEIIIDKKTGKRREYWTQESK